MIYPTAFLFSNKDRHGMNVAKSDLLQEESKDHKFKVVYSCMIQCSKCMENLAMINLDLNDSSGISLEANAVVDCPELNTATDLLIGMRLNWTKALPLSVDYLTDAVIMGIKKKASKPKNLICP